MRRWRRDQPPDRCVKLPWLITRTVITAMLAAVPAASAEPVETKVFQSKAGGYKITLPGDWVEVPQGVLREYLHKAAKQTGRSEESKVQACYASGSSGREIKPPYVAVTINSEGPIAEDQIGKFYSGLDRSLKDVADKATNVFGGVRNSSRDYDSRRHLLEVESKFSATAVGGVDGHTAIFFTSKGMITFVCCALESDTNSLQTIFKPAIDSVQIDPELAYDLTRAPGMSLKQIVVCFLLACVIWVGIRLGMRRIVGRPKTIISGQS